ncbi:MAG TPA: hypothetical protein VF777_13580 [Phycisphaerales bacterium]
MNSRLAVSSVSIAAILASLAWVTAGPISPPSGPVGPTGKTNQEIFDAVQSGNASSSAAGRIAALAGRDEFGGEIDFAAATGIPARSTTIVGAKVDLMVPLSGGLPTGRVQLREFSVVRDVGKHAYAPFKGLTSNVQFPEITVRLINSEGLVTYTLKKVRVSSLTVELKQRTDGTFSQLETIMLAPESLEIKTNEGTAVYNIIAV